MKYSNQYQINTTQPLLATAALLLSLCLATHAFAWGRVGHAVIAARAQSKLDPAAQRALAPMLASLGVHSLADIASWPDDRDIPANRALSKSHYVNLPPDCHYVRERDCPGDRCVVEELRHQVAILSDTSLSTQARSAALTYVVHFVADAQQPLHAGMASDKGGNTYQIRDGQRGTSLHHFWDTLLFEDLTGTRDEATEFDSLMSMLDRRNHSPNQIALSPQAWVERSCRFVQQPGFYPDRFITQQYVRWATPIALDQLQVGSDELAATIDQALDGRPPF